MDPRPRRRAQTVAYDGKQMPTGSAEDRLCDLAGCPRRSETLVASGDGSVLLVCTSCATQMSAPVPAPEPRLAPAVVPVTAWEDDTAEFPAVREEVLAPAPTPAAALAPPYSSSAASRSREPRAWSFWLRLVVGVAFTLWGLGLLAGDAGAFDAVVTAALGVYLLLDVARPRYRD